MARKVSEETDSRDFAGQIVRYLSRAGKGRGEQLRLSANEMWSKRSRRPSEEQTNDGGGQCLTTYILR